MQFDVLHCTFAAVLVTVCSSFSLLMPKHDRIKTEIEIQFQSTIEHHVKITPVI